MSRAPSVHLVALARRVRCCLRWGMAVRHASRDLCSSSFVFEAVTANLINHVNMYDDYITNCSARVNRKHVAPRTLRKRLKVQIWCVRCAAVVAERNEKGARAQPRKEWKMQAATAASLAWRKKSAERRRAVISL